MLGLPRQSAATEPSLARTLLFAAAFLGCFGYFDAVVVASLSTPPKPLSAPTPASIAPPAATVAIPAAPPANPPPAPKPVTAETLPPLPETTLSRMPVHTIPEPNVPERHVSPEVANGPSHLGALSAPPKQFSGNAQVSGVNALVVGNVPVQLFGIKSPARDDRCGGENCLVVAQRALAARVPLGHKISCQAPFPKAGIIVAFAICLDAEGTDIGGYLVAAGLALADPGQSYDYVGAESIARGQKRGLWAFRSAPAH